MAVEDQSAILPTALHVRVDVTGRQVVLARSPNLMRGLVAREEIRQVLLVFEHEDRGRRDVAMAIAMSAIATEAQDGEQELSIPCSAPTIPCSPEQIPCSWSQGILR